MAKASSSHGHTRSRASFARPTGTRPTRKLVLLVCEGAETEPRYFKALAQRLHLSVTVRPGKGGSPESTVIHALDEIRRLQACWDEVRYDEVWCILDTEGSAQTDALRRAVDAARGKHFKLAISNPSFEFWYLLHFEETSRPFADSEALERLLTKYIPNYHKSLDVFDIVYPHTSAAIRRAESIQASREAKADSYPNPSTTVHVLVRSLSELAGQ